MPIYSTLIVSQAGMASVLSEASLSFLAGLHPASFWGVISRNPRSLTIQLRPSPYLSRIDIALTVLALNFIGEGLREYRDPRQEQVTAGSKLAGVGGDIEE